MPSLPQDEVLAYLLYGQREAALGPLQIAQIAATLASLVGGAPAVSNPLEGLRTAIGLDRLTIARVRRCKQDVTWRATCMSGRSRA